MGILDDAIREHLELKRAHGASDDELRRKEAEAFGPIRQEAAHAAEADHATQMLRADDLDDELRAAPGVHPDPNAEHALHPHEAEAGAPSAGDGPALDAPTEHHEVDALQPAPEDPYTVHPGDHPVPDPHDHAHTGGSDPAWADDTELFGAEPSREAASGPAGGDDVPPAAAAGAGMMEPSGHHSDPGPPVPPDHHLDEQHPALHDHDAFHAEEHAPEPVFRQETAAAAEVESPAAPPQDESPAPPDAPLDPAPVEDPPVGDPPVERPEIDEPPPRQSPEPAADAGDSEDVLEETPEFLQDAPEHDRLWFEQKPPRDFDFGE